MTPIADTHVCKLPHTWNRTEYAEFECFCGRHWFLSWLERTPPEHRHDHDVRRGDCSESAGLALVGVNYRDTSIQSGPRQLEHPETKIRHMRYIEVGGVRVSALG